MRYQVEIYRAHGVRFENHRCDGRYEVWQQAVDAMIEALTSMPAIVAEVRLIDTLRQQHQ